MLIYKKYFFFLFTIVLFLAMPKISLAASRYWVGSGTTWSDTASWSATSGGSSGASVPGVSDDVFFDSNSTGDSSLNASISIRSLDMTGYTHHLNFNNLNMTLTFAANGGTNVTAKFAHVQNTSATDYLAFNSTTSPSSYLFTSGGGSFGGIKIGPAGVATTVTLQDSFNSDDSLYLYNGTLDTNSQAVTFAELLLFPGTKTLTLGNSILNLIMTSGTPWNAVTNGAGFTLNAGTSTIKYTGTFTSDLTFAGNG